MPFLFVFVKNPANTAEKRFVDIFEPFRDVFMHGRFRDPEFLRRISDRRAFFRDVSSESERAERQLFVHSLLPLFGVVAKATPAVILFIPKYEEGMTIILKIDPRCRSMRMQKTQKHKKRRKKGCFCPRYLYCKRREAFPDFYIKQGCKKRVFFTAPSAECGAPTQDSSLQKKGGIDSVLYKTDEAT